MPGPDLVTSASNPLVRRLRALKRQGADDGLCLLEGPKLVEEALAAGATLEVAAGAPRLLRSARGRAVAAALEEAGVRLRWLGDRLLESLSETEASQGLLALARRPRFGEDAPFTGVPLLLVAVGVQNPGNVGALLRTAEAAGATGAFLVEGCADPFSWKALRGSMGSAFRLPHRRASAAEALRRLADHGVRALAAVSRDAEAHHRSDLRGAVAFLLGAEGLGLPEDLAAACQGRVRIPMRAPVESLNVSVAAGVLLYEAARQRRATL